MKSVSILLLVLALVGLAQSLNFVKSTRTFYGSTSDWKDYTASARGVYVDVDMSSLNLKNPPNIQTWLSCTGFCWSAAGASNVHNYSNTGFSVYVYQIQINWTVALAHQHNWVLHYRIDSLDE